MCTGLEILSAVGSGLSAAKALGVMGNDSPQATSSNPVADQSALDTQAAQDAQASKLEAKRRARANSLLSSYGGEGDTSNPTGSAGMATGKLSLGG